MPTLLARTTRPTLALLLSTLLLTACGEKPCPSACASNQVCLAGVCILDPSLVDLGLPDIRLDGVSDGGADTSPDGSGDLGPDGGGGDGIGADGGPDGTLDGADGPGDAASELPDIPPPCGPAPVAGDLIVNEVLVNPGGKLDANQSGFVESGGDEFVEVVSRASGPLDMSGVRIEESKGKGVTLPAGTCLQPNQALLVFGKWSGGNLGAALAFGLGGEFGLNDGGDEVSVWDAAGAGLAQAVWGSSSGNGQSLVRQSDLAPNSPFVLHGNAPLSEGAPMSPGTCQGGQAFPDCGEVVLPVDATDGGGDATLDAGDTDEDVGPACGAAPEPGQLVLNEILSNPGTGGVDVNQDGNASATQDEFVEIVNLTGGELDLKGVQLFAGTPDELSPVHTFGTLCLGPFEGVVLFGGGAPTLVVASATFGVSDKSLGLSNSGETVTLRTSGGTVLDSYTYTSLVGQSWARVPEGVGGFAHHSESASASGAPWSPGACLDGSALPSCLQ